ncbi:uncharacterized protein LOC135338094 [Halichondria panicea]|uniref:uncharacterized protein LOC135338094 n=1 Tax=Halichondria panicea TaxID=6063 RepID=UPI00312B8A1F
MLSTKAEVCDMDEYKDGLAFRFKMPKKDLSLRGVSIEDGVPTLLFSVAKKVPSIQEEEVAMCIRLSQENKRPEFSYNGFLPDHPLAGTGRQFKNYKPLYTRRTSIGETLAEIDWQMKCLMVGVRSDKNKEKFWSWTEKSNVDGLASFENFERDPSKDGGVYMKCKRVSICEDANQILFEGEPEMAINSVKYPAYSRYITEHFDSVAYYDEPLFLKMKEYIKLILAVEWLKEKGVHFSQNWIQEHTAPTYDPPKSLQVELSAEETNSLKEEELKEEAKKEVLQGLSQFKYIRVPEEPTVTVNSKGFEITLKQTIDFFHVPLVQKIVVRATTHDFDFLYEGIDPNMPVTLNPDTKETIIPEVKSWSELMGETEFFPCKWLQDPSNVMVRSPALTGGISTTNIPVHRVNKSAPVRSTPVTVKASKNLKAQKIHTSAVPTQNVVNAPSSSALVNRPAIATGGAQWVHGRKDASSSVGMSRDGITIKQSSIHVHGQITQLIDGREVGPRLSLPMHLRLPPKPEASDNEVGPPSMHLRLPPKAEASDNEVGPPPSKHLRLSPKAEASDNKVGPPSMHLRLRPKAKASDNEVGPPPSMHLRLRPKAKASDNKVGPPSMHLRLPPKPKASDNEVGPPSMHLHLPPKAEASDNEVGPPPSKHLRLSPKAEASDNKVGPPSMHLRLRPKAKASDNKVGPPSMHLRLRPKAKASDNKVGPPSMHLRLRPKAKASDNEVGPPSMHLRLRPKS